VGKDEPAGRDLGSKQSFSVGKVPLGKLMVTHKLLQGLEEMSLLAFGVGLTQVLIEYGRRRSGAAAACGVL
jgi:hypothetical protein